MNVNQARLLPLLFLTSCSILGSKPPPVYGPLPPMLPAQSRSLPPLPSSYTVGMGSAPVLKVLPRIVTPQVLAGATPQVSIQVSRHQAPPPSVTLAWDPVPDPQLGFYSVYYGVGPGNYTNVTSGITNTSLTITGLSFGTQYFSAATDTNTNGVESVYSGEVTWITQSQPLPPGNYRIQVLTVKALPGLWIPDTNFGPVLVQNPLGNQYWKLIAAPVP